MSGFSELLYKKYKMYLGKMALQTVAILVYVGVVAVVTAGEMSLSEGAGLQVAEIVNHESGSSLDSIESLAASKILMDHTSSLSTQPAKQLLPLSLLPLPGPSSSSPPPPASSASRFVSENNVSVFPENVVTEEEAVVIKQKSNNSGAGTQSKDETSVRYPLHVAQCRAACLAKVC